MRTPLLVGLLMLVAAACNPSADVSRMKPIGTAADMQSAPPSEPQLPPGYTPGKWIMARGFEFSGFGIKSTLLSVRNEETQVFTGTQKIERRLTAEDCAAAAAEAAQRVGLKVRQRGAQIWFDGSNLASVFSHGGCPFEPKR